VQKFEHRHLWYVEEAKLEKGPGGGLTYQDEDATEVPMQSNEANVQTRLRRDRQRVLVDAAVVEIIKKRRKEVVHGHDNEDGEHDDGAMFQYFSDDEENSTAHQDHDDE
jgi:hypothetical protein